MATVLIVDDAKAMIAKLRKMLEKAGHQVVGEAYNGREGLKKYADVHPDLVTMDITMPDMNGIEAVTLIMEMDSNAKIVMITSHGEKSMVIEAVLAGAKHYLIKPIRQEKLEEVIHSVLTDGMSPKDQPAASDQPPYIIETTKSQYNIRFFPTFVHSHLFSFNQEVEKLIAELEIKLFFDFTAVSSYSNELICELGAIMIKIIENNGELLIYTENQFMKDQLLQYDSNLKVISAV